MIALTPTELRRLADECESRGGSYVTLLYVDTYNSVIAARLDDESGGEHFTIATAS